MYTCRTAKPGPFVNLSTLKYNDQIIVHAWGQRYIYQVRSVLEVRPDNVSVISHEDLSWLTLDYLPGLRWKPVITLQFAGSSQGGSGLRSKRISHSLALNKTAC